MTAPDSSCITLPDGSCIAEECMHGNQRHVHFNGTQPKTVYVNNYAWTCPICGWLGTGLESLVQAYADLTFHAWQEHQVALCGSDNKRFRHDWQRVPHSDQTFRCIRCGKWSGK